MKEYHANYTTRAAGNGTIGRIGLFDHLPENRVLFPSTGGSETQVHASSPTAGRLGRRARLGTSRNSSCWMGYGGLYKPTRTFHSNREGDRLLISRTRSIQLLRGQPCVSSPVVRFCQAFGSNLVSLRQSFRESLHTALAAIIAIMPTTTRKRQLRDSDSDSDGDTSHRAHSLLQQVVVNRVGFSHGGMGRTRWSTSLSGWDTRSTGTKRRGEHPHGC